MSIDMYDKIFDQILLFHVRVWLARLCRSQQNFTLVTRAQIELVDALL